MTRVSQTRPGHGSGCPWVRVRVTVRAPVTRDQPISKATANTGQQRPTQVNAGPQQPAKANAGPRRRKRDSMSFFVMYILSTFYFLLFNYYKAHQGPQQPTTANAGQCMPTAANKGQCRPTKNRYVFFCNVHFIVIF